MPTVTTRDGVDLYYKDWGTGRPVVFSHGWPLSTDAWDEQLKVVADNGLRAIALDRRGHGRSDHPWGGYDFDTFADDLHDLITSLDLRDVTLVGHSTGGGEVARYIGRHGTGRISQAVLLSAVPPLMIKNEANPEGVPAKVLEDTKSGIMADRSQFWKDFSESFYGANRSGNRVSQGIRDTFWLLSMQANIEAAVECVDAFGLTDFHEDLKKFNIPTLVAHGDDDQVVPFEATGRKTAQLVPGATLKVYEGGPHGITGVPGYKEKFNADLLAFLQG